MPDLPPPPPFGDPTIRFPNARHPNQGPLLRSGANPGDCRDSVPAQAAGLKTGPLRKGDQEGGTIDHDPSGHRASLAGAGLETRPHPITNQLHLEEVLSEVWEDQRRSVRAIDGATEVLKALKAMGLRLGLLSSTWHPLYASFLRNCSEMAELLDYAVLSYRLGYKKPSPEFFRLALAEADAPAEQCWMIGDSYELDIEPAMLVGMHTIWVLRRPEKERLLLAQVLRGEKPCPDWSAAHLDEVVAYFSRKGSV